jgi:fatty acid desaturase
VTNVFIPSAQTVTDADFVCKTMKTTVHIKVNFAIYAITLMTIFGWAILMFFLPVGMWAYPFEYCGLFINRQKPMNPDQFNLAKGQLAQTVQHLLNKGKELLTQKEQSLKGLEGRALSRFMAKRNLAK